MSAIAPPPFPPVSDQQPFSSGYPAGVTPEMRIADKHFSDKVLQHLSDIYLRYGLNQNFVSHFPERQIVFLRRLRSDFEHARQIELQTNVYRALAAKIAALRVFFTASGLTALRVNGNRETQGVSLMFAEAETLQFLGQDCGVTVEFSQSDIRQAAESVLRSGVKVSPEVRLDPFRVPLSLKPVLDTLMDVAGETRVYNRSFLTELIAQTSARLSEQRKAFRAGVVKEFGEVVLSEEGGRHQKIVEAVTKIVETHRAARAPSVPHVTQTKVAPPVEKRPAPRGSFAGLTDRDIARIQAEAERNFPGFLRRPIEPHKRIGGEMVWGQQQIEPPPLPK